MIFFFFFLLIDNISNFRYSFPVTFISFIPGGISDEEPGLFKGMHFCILFIVFVINLELVELAGIVGDEGSDFRMLLTFHSKKLLV